MSKLVKVIDSCYEFGNLDIFNEHTHGTQWFMLKLECGHIVGRYTPPNKEEPPKQVRCEYCEENQDRISANSDFSSDDYPDFFRNSDTGLHKVIKGI